MPEEDSYASMVAQYIGIPLNVINVEGYFRHVPPEKPQTPLPEPTGIPVPLLESHVSLSILLCVYDAVAKLSDCFNPRGLGD